MIWKWLIQNLAKLNLKTYLFFLAITSVLWLMMKLSDEYNKTIEIPLTFSDVKAGYIIVNQPAKSISISVSAEGFKMLSFALGRNDPISIPLNMLQIKSMENGYFYGSISTASLKKTISNQLETNMEGKNIKPDSIVFVFDKIDTVNVPVKLQSKIEIIPGFRIYGSPKVSPAVVRVIGPKHITDTLSGVATKPLVLKDISAPFEREISLRHYDDFLKINTNKVKVKMDVVEFIEAEINVPVTVFSKIPNLKVKTFPHDIMVKFQVAMPDYNNITDSLFVVGVEIDSLSALRNTSLIPKIYNYPSYIENPRLTTDKVDFIILDK